MKKISISVALIASVMLFSSCEKNKEVRNPYEPTSLKGLFAQHGPKFESFIIDASAGGSLTTSKGTKITFPANAFVDKNNQPVSGDVRVHVKDIMQPSDMILGDKPTIDQKGNFLRSFGELIVKAEQDGRELDLNDAGAEVVVPLGARENAQQGNGIPIWHGDTTIVTTTYGYNHENQPTTVSTPVNAPVGVIWQDLGTVGISNPAGTQTSFVLDALGDWRNCDALINTGGTRTTVLGYFTNHFASSTGSNYMGEEPSMLFFKQRGSNTLIKLYNVILNAPEGKQGLHSYQQSFTVGTEGTFLAMTAQDGKYYAQMLDTTIPAPAAGKDYVGYDFVLQEVSETELISLINLMNSK